MLTKTPYKLALFMKSVSLLDDVEPHITFCFFSEFIIITPIPLSKPISNKKQKQKQNKTKPNKQTKKKRKQL